MVARKRPSRIVIAGTGGLREDDRLIREVAWRAAGTFYRLGEVAGRHGRNNVATCVANAGEGYGGAAWVGRFWRNRREQTVGWRASGGLVIYSLSGTARGRDNRVACGSKTAEQ